MATDMHVNIVEDTIGHEFSQKKYITQALTAAGVDNDNWDGNRKLALLGESLLEFLLVDNAVADDKDRGTSHHTLLASSRLHHR